MTACGRRACGRGDVRVAQPLLHEGDIGLVLQSVRRGRCAERMERQAFNLHLGRRGVALHELVDRFPVDRLLQVSIHAVADRAEEGALLVFTVPQELEVGIDRGRCCGVT